MSQWHQQYQMSNNLVKSGTLHRFSKGTFVGEKWKRSYCTLYKDGTFFWFKNKGDATSNGNVSLKTVHKFITVGGNIRAIPHNPDLPSWGNIDYVIAFPQEPSKKSKVFFFLADSEEDMRSWMAAINQVIPQAPPASGGPPPSYASAPPQPPAYGAAPPGAPPQPHTGYTAPPPGAPPMPTSAPPPRSGLGFDSVAMPQPGPGYPAYPPQPPAGAYQPPPPPAGAYQPPPNPYPTQPPAGYAAPPAGYAPPPPGYAPPPAGYAHGSAPPPPQGYHGYPQQQPAYPQQHTYPRQQYAAYPQQGYTQPMGYGQPAAQTVYVKDKKSKNKGYGKMALGLAGGAVAGYAASRMFSPFGFGFGHGSWGSGSWGSGSFGSFGSFGSCGS